MKTPIVYASLAFAAALSLSVPLTAEARGGHGGQRIDFEAVDTDGNGEITISEMEAAGAARFAELDADGNGSLTNEELLAAAQNQERMAKRVERMMKRMDANENGTIEADELGPNAERRAERFARLDTDGSGGISQAEFEAAKEGRKGGRDGKRGNGN